MSLSAGAKLPLQLLNVTINSINIATAVIFEEMKNINNYYQKLKNKAKQKAQHPPKTESASTGEKGPGAQTGLQTPGGGGEGTPHPHPKGRGAEPGIRTSPCRGLQTPRMQAGSEKRKWVL